MTVRNLEIVEVDTEDNVIAGEGRGPRAEWRLRHGAEGQEIAMPSVDIIDLNNQKVGTIELADAVFAAPVNENLLYEAVRHHLAGVRRGTASTKTRHEVAGSGKKLWKQKGTGRARMGSIRQSSVAAWRHHARPATARLFLQAAAQDAAGRAARALSPPSCATANCAWCNEFAVAQPKTKQMRQALDAVEIERTVLLVDNAENENLALSSRNLQGVKLVPSHEVNVYDLLGHQQVLMSAGRGAETVGGSRIRCPVYMEFSKSRS